MLTHVSIHASVKDATKSKINLRASSIVSIHASVKDATSHKEPCQPEYPFQSTHL